MVIRGTKGSVSNATGQSGREVTSRRKTAAGFVRNVKVPRWLFDKADEMLEDSIPSQGKKEGPKATLPKGEHLKLAQALSADMLETHYPATLLCSLVCELYRSGNGVDALDPERKRTTQDVVKELAENTENACGRAQRAAVWFLPVCEESGNGKKRWVRNPFAQELTQEIKKARFVMGKIAHVCGVVLRPDPATGRMTLLRRQEPKV